MLRTLFLLFASFALSAAGPVEDGSKARSAGFIEAKALIDAGAFELALERLRTLAKTEGGDADVQNLLGFAARNAGDLETAEIAYARALTIEPNHLEALEYQGEMYLAQGRPDEATANLERLEKLCPAGCEPREELRAAILEWRAERGS